MKRYFKWLAGILIVATLFGGILGCKQEVEVPSDKTAPADVTSLTVTASNGNAVLSWKNPADTDFAGVQISMSPAEGTLKNAVILGKEVTSLDVSGLTVGKEYTFTVKTFDKSLNYSEGAEEKATVADTADYTAPAEVTELTVQAANGNAVLNWKNPADADFAGVQISMSPAEGTLKNAVSLGKNVVSFDVSGLENGKEYTFTVKAFDESLNYSEGAEAKATVADTADYTAPADVTELTATNKDASVLLTWTDATDEDIYGYEVTWNKNAPINRSAAMEANSMMVAPGAKGCYISNLTNGTEYAFTVKSVDTSGNKSAGVTKTITPSIIEKSALQISLEPNTTEKTNQDVVITVNATTDSASKIKKITYVEGTESKIDTVLAGKNITDIRQITATENTTFTVAVTDTAGRRELAFITVSNIDKEAPSQVTNTEVTYFGALNKFMLSWTNPSDEDFAGIVITYGKKDSEETTTIELSNDKTSYEIENIPDDDSEYTISLKTKDDVENFAEIVILVASKGATISGVTIPNAGEGYTGELPVTIIGENLKGYVITCSDSSFGNVNYVSDNMIKATVNCNGIVGENTITVTCGASSANCTVKVVESEKCFSVGDVLFTDGTRIKAQYGIPDSQLSKAFAVIASAPYGGTVGKAVGLQRSATKLLWAPSGTTGYNTNFTKIQADFSGDSSSGYTFTGDIDGSDNWEYICSIDPEGTQEAATNYPAFNFALTYGTQAGLTGTEYENGWYVPSVAELYDVYTNKEVAQTSLNAVGGFTLGKSYYWSSSQRASSNSYASLVSFDVGVIKYGNKNGNYGDVFVLQAFNVEQFNNYEVTTIPSITSVTVANAGEGYTGELPVTIIGENLKGHAITSNDASFGNVTNISDTKATATITCSGVVGESTITVTSGTSKASGTVKVVAAENCYSVGDILFTDGTRIKAEDVQYGIPNSQLSKAFAVIASAPYGGGTGKAVGLQRSSSALEWAPVGTTGYNTNFTKIQADYSRSTSSGYTFSGDIDGSDNWEYICSIDPEGTKDPATNYPAFNFALTYETQAGLTETEYENGWYVPSVAELYDVYTNKEVVQTSLNAVGGFTLGTGYYWSSSQNASNNNNAYQVDFNHGYVVVSSKGVNYIGVFVLQAFNVEQFNNYEYGTPSITSVTVDNAGEGYTGELPVTIIGENLKGHAITSNDASFGNVTYLSDTKATATIHYDGSNNTITVTSGTSSATGTVKVVAEENCYSVGDILFTDGTRIKAENVQYGVPDSQLDKAFAVIASAPYGGGVGKAVGLQRSSDYLNWAPNGTTGYSTNFIGIQATSSGDRSSGYTFTGDIDGSDNWEYICSIEPEGTQDAATNYPAFNFALTYGTQSGLTGTEYETGWYVPSVAELYDVYTNKEVVQTSLNVAGGFTLGTGYYWSSSQYASNLNFAYQVNFNYGYVNDTVKDVDNDVFVLQAFNVEQFNNYEYGTPSITSVTVDNAGEGYTGELPVTIIGENLKGYAITSNDASFGNVNYVSDNMIKATVNCNGIVGENTITVTSGTSSATGIVKVVAAEKCYSVGDILFTDGTRIKAEKVQYGVPNSQLSKAFAVIASAPYGGAEGKAIGLQRSSSTLNWSPSGTTGYSTNFTKIQADFSGNSSRGYTFSGDIDGSDNWEYICSIDPEGTQDAATNYPAFNFALTYGTQAGLTGTDYETGWYVPSVAEFYDVYTNKEVVQTSLNAVGGFTLGTSWYWSSTQYASVSNYAYRVTFNAGYVGNNSKDYDYVVFVLQAYNAEQFNNYEYGTPSIASVTVANAGEGYTGEIPVTIIGENLKGHAITCSDASFSNVNYVSDNMIKATVNCNGVVGESAITVTSETSSASCTVKVVAAEKCFTVGDIVFTDGTIIKAEKVQYGIPDSQLSKALAVITSVSYGGGVGKAVGLQRSSGYLGWAPSGTTGYSTNFTGIQVDYSGDSSSGYTFSGDIDGSDNWEYICSIDPEGTQDAATNYPAFNFALTYGTTAGLTETEYENGWYVPSVAELYDVYTNKEVVQTSLNVAGGFTLGYSYYWSSSQAGSNYRDAYRVYFDDGYVYNNNKISNFNVFVLQAFNAEQFN